MSDLNSDDLEQFEGYQGPRLWLVNRFGWYWLLVEWWQYVLDDSRCHNKSQGDDEIFNGRWWWWLADRWSGPIRFAAYLFRCQCRARSHPYGVSWYSSGLEPDMDCCGCGEDLG